MINGVILSIFITSLIFTTPLIKLKQIKIEDLYQKIKEKEMLNLMLILKTETQEIHWQILQDDSGSLIKHVPLRRLSQ